MKLWKVFVHYFVPNERNTYKPLFLRLEVAGFVIAVIIGLFALSVATQRVLVTSNSPQVAAVVVSTLVDLANADRQQNDLPSLTPNAQLQEAAQLKANDMASKGYFAHESPDGRDPWYWFSQAGYNFVYAGENLAVYFSDSDAVNTAWMNSPEHRANILSDHFTQIGIATAEGMYEGKETTFVVQEFGSPAAVAVAPEPDLSSAPAAPAVVSTQPAAPVATAETPKVEGASIQPPQVKVISQDQNFIAVENMNVPAPTLAQASAPSVTVPTSDPITLFFLKFITSPESDLIDAYEFIAGVIALALILEVGVELKRQHPHRIALGLSLVSLMLVLVFVGHVFVFGQLQIV